MDVMYEVAALTPYTTGTCFPFLGLLGDHECCSRDHSQQNSVPPRNLEVPEPAESDRNLLGNPRLEKWLELPSYISGSECSTTHTVSTVSSLALSSDPCLRDISWGNKELCSTKYDLEDIEGFNFISVSDPDHQLLDLSQSMSAAVNLKNEASLDPPGQGSGQCAQTSEIENLLAKIASDMNELRAMPERNFANPKQQMQPLKNPGTTVNHETFQNPPPASLPMDLSQFITALSNQTDDDIFTTAESHFDNDDDSSSAFSSCRVSRASSQCDLQDIGRNLPDSQCFEKSATGQENTSSRTRKQPLAIKSVNPMTTMFTPPQGKEEKLTTALSIDLESWKGYETCGSSGYCDSPTASSVFSDFSEFSCLNPLSKPFVPKSSAGEVFDEGISLIDKQFHTLQIDSLVADSGIEQTNLVSASLCPNVHSVTDISDSKRTEYIEEILDSVAESQETFSETRSTSTEPIPAYMCSVPHGREFTSIKDFSLFSLPEKCRSIKNLEAIKAVSQRVVKLRVSKPFSLLSNGTSEPTELFSSSVFNNVNSDFQLFDHYGTGFAYDVGSDRIAIRTHCKVVGSAEEASRTQVWFTVTSKDGHVIVSSSEGQKEGFSLKTNSQDAVFTCNTPPELRAHLNVFREVPTLNRMSLFANDSCYYSDLSSDSMSDHEEFSTEPLLIHKEHTASDIKPESFNKNMSYADVVSCKTSKSIDGLEENTCLLHVNASQERDKELEWTSVNGSNDNTCGFKASLSVFDPRVRQAFESVAPDDESARLASEVDTPLVLSERRFDIDQRNGCPYASEETFGNNAQYSYFSSYAGDVFSLFPWTRGTNEWSTPWSYEYLVYSQNHQRDSYNRQHGLSLKEHSECANPDHSVDASVSKDSVDIIRTNRTKNSQISTTVFQTRGSELDSVDEYLKSWDKDLLNLDDNLNCLPPYDPARNCLPPYDPARNCLPPYDPARNCLPPYDPARNCLPPYDPARNCIPPYDPARNCIPPYDPARNCIPPYDPARNCLPPYDPARNCIPPYDPARNCLPPYDPARNCIPPYDPARNCIPPYDPARNCIPPYDPARNCIPPYDPVRILSSEYRVRKVEYTDETINSEQYFDDMVNSIVGDDLDSSPSKTTRLCCQKSFFPAGRQTGSVGGRGGERGGTTYAVIISHVHGGQKVLSVGQFSRHHHTGGDLYDTPTCMGSCGATVLALSETCDSPIVTHLVHAGTTRVNGISTGIGFAFFV